MERFEKQISEEWTITGEFSENMSDSESIASCTVTARDKDGVDASAAVLYPATKAIVNQGVDIMVFGGEVAKEPYIITFKCVTDYPVAQPHKWEIDVKMRVKDN